MNSSRAVFASFFWIGFIASIVTLAAFADRLSAATHLFLYAIAVTSFLIALGTSCYQAPGPGEVLIIFGGVKPKVRHGGAFVFPVITQVSRFSLSPISIEFPREWTSDGKIPLNPENRLITKDGLPVTTRALVQIVAGDEDESIIKVVQSSAKGGSDVKEDLTKLLGLAVAAVIGETNLKDLQENHQGFEDGVAKRFQLEKFGYRSMASVKIRPVMQLSIDEAGLQGGDKIRAQQVLNILEKQQEIHKIEQENEVSKAKDTREIEQIRRDVTKKEEEQKKVRIEHESNKETVRGEGELARLKLEVEEGKEKRRIEKDLATERATLEKDRDLANVKVEKLLNDAKVKTEEHNLRLAEGEATKKENALRAQADSDVGAIRLKFKEEEERSAIRLRSEELKQNIENQDGDLEYQLKKLVLKAATELGRESATVIAAALAKANLTLIGDPSAAAQLATEQMKALGLGARGKEILALLQDVRLHDAIGDIVHAIRRGPISSQPPEPGAAERDIKAVHADGHLDRTFEP